MNVAVIPYLNCAPFYCSKSHLKLDSQSIHWVPLNPKEIGDKVRAGGIDAGPVSLVDSFNMENDFEPLSGLGIVSEGPAMSVLAFSRKPLKLMTGKTAALTPQSVTSVELFKILLKHKYGVKAKFVTGFHNGEDARVLIGDDALRAGMDKNYSKEFPVLSDLGEEWRDWQNLPFVFARWMVRKSLPGDQKKMLADLLEKNLKASLKNFQAAADWHYAESGWNYPGAADYLSKLRYRIGEEENKAVRIFRALLEEKNQ